MTRLALLVAGVAIIATGVWLATRTDDGTRPANGSEPATEATSGPRAAPAIDEPQPAPSPTREARPAADPEAETDTAEELVFDAFQFTTLQQILDAVGIDRDYEAWARARGEPDRSLLLGDQGYADMPEETLRALAAQGDPTAVSVLAGRLLTERPLESLDLLRQQVDRGSAYAIDRMAMHLRFLSETLGARSATPWDADQQARIRLIGEDAAALRTEAMAWTLVDEVYSGRTRGSKVTEFFAVEAGALPLELGAACQRATELYGQLQMTWQAQQIAEPPTGPPPLGHGSPAPRPEYLEACPADALPTPDLSDCRTLSMSFQEDAFPLDWQMYACPEAPGG